MIKACIFDLDGTLTNSLFSIAYFVNNAISQFDIPNIEPEKFKTLTGNGAETLIRRVLQTVEKNNSDIEKIILDNYNSSYDKNPTYLCKIYEGIPELISTLNEKKISVNVLSNKPHDTTKKVVKALFGEKCFSHILGARNGVPLKPDPYGVYEILNFLNLKSEECLYIGDTATDIQTGKNAKLFTIGVLWGFRDKHELEKAGADAIIEHPNEIINLLNQL